MSRNVNKQYLAVSHIKVVGFTVFIWLNKKIILTKIYSHIASLNALFDFYFQTSIKVKGEGAGICVVKNTVLTKYKLI